MHKVVLLGVSAVVLGGCAMPVPFQIASWALDGISMLATQKSVTDHGISLVTQQDCAVWRGVTEGELCRDNAPDDVLVAEDVVKMPGDSNAKRAASPRVSALATRAPVIHQPQTKMATSSTVAVRAVSSHALRAAWSESRQMVGPETGAVRGNHALRAMPVRAVIRQAETETLKPAPVKRVQLAALVPEPAPIRKSADRREPVKGVYFVIGSFRNPDNARRLVRGNGSLSPAVLSARLDGSEVYRVVVGPVPRGREKRLHRALARSGFPDTWAIRVQPSDWQFAKLPIPRSKASPELAALQK